MRPAVRATVTRNGRSHVAGPQRLPAYGVSIRPASAINSGFSVERITSRKSPRGIGKKAADRRAHFGVLSAFSSSFPQIAPRSPNLADHRLFGIPGGIHGNWHPSSCARVRDNIAARSSACCDEQAFTPTDCRAQITSLCKLPTTASRNETRGTSNRILRMVRRCVIASAHILLIEPPPLLLWRPQSP